MALQVDDSEDEPQLNADLYEDKHESGEGSSARNFMATGDQRMLIKQRFRPKNVKIIMAEVMNEVLKDKTYDAEVVMFWTQTITDKIKEKVKELGYERYKLIVNVQLFELKGQGFKLALKAIWDEATDSFAHELYIGVSMACSAVCCGMFFY